MKAAILMTESAALRAAEDAIDQSGGDLRSVFPSFFRGDGYLKAIADARAREAEAGRIAAQGGAICVVSPAKGGVYAALWEMGEILASGMRVQLKKIPIRQETVEICEYLDIDPYAADSSGALVIAAHDGVVLAEAYAAAGIPCAVIGVLTDGRARTIEDGDHVRYLDKPRFH